MRIEWNRMLVVGALIAQLLWTAGPAVAQEDAPIPPGDPATWGIPGHVVKLPVKPAPPSTIFSAPSPQGNEALNRSTGPAGEAEEKYTGGPVLGGVAGSGIDRFGIPEDRW